MRHRMRGRKLGRSPSHRRSMLRNMACSLIRTLEQNEDDPMRARVAGRIVTTLPKAKELRPFVEKLITLAKKGRQHELAAAEIKSDVPEKGGNPEGRSEWRRFRESEEYAQWHETLAPAIACRRRAFSLLRDKLAVDILFDELADRFTDRPGGYTRVLKLATVRLGDAGRQALIEFVGEDDKVEKRESSLAVDEEAVDEEAVDEEAGDEEAGDEEASSATEDEEVAEAQPEEEGEANGESEADGS
ncbi:MAG: L17 family ribosomal protein [Planctomycetota bacterium]|nr:L17 family ribosomal protein [Planctomycetota bacterium]